MSFSEFPSIRTCLACLAVACWSPAYVGQVRAEEQVDRLELNDGSERVGQSIDFAADGLKWRDATGEEITIPFSAIKSIEYDVAIPSPASSQTVAIERASESESLDPISPRAEESSGPEFPDPEPVADQLTDEAENNVRSEDLEAALSEPEPDDANWMGSESLSLVYDRLSTAGESIACTVAETSKEFSVGARWLQGNSDDLYVNLLAKFEREAENTLAQMDAGGQYGKSSGALAANRWYINMTEDFSREGQWIVFAASRNEYDELEDLYYRGTLSGGLGYRFYNDKNKRLITRLGPAVTREIYSDSSQNRTTPDLYGELQIRWPAFHRAIFDHKTNVHPSVKDWDIVRIVSTSDLSVPLDDLDRWKLSLGLRYEFNGSPNPGRQSADYTSNISLVYKRK